MRAKRPGIIAATRAAARRAAGVGQGLADRPAPDRPPAAGRLDVAEDVGGQLARAEDRLAG
jgi:hypothetical protein